MQSYRYTKHRKVQASVSGVSLKNRTCHTEKGMMPTVAVILMCLLAEKGGWI